MKKKRLGKTGLMVTPVGMGGIPIMRLNMSEAAKVVRGVLDLGINFIDTAYYTRIVRKKSVWVLKEKIDMMW